MFFAPTVEGKVLPKVSSDLLTEKSFHKVPYIIGVNNTEGDGLLSMMAGGDFAKGLTVDEAKATLTMRTPVCT